jgi:hypothetical protein
MSVIRSAIRSAIQPAIRSAISTVQRFFLTYGGVNEQSSWAGSTITGDCSIPFKFINRGTAGVRTIIGHSADIQSRVYCEGSNLKAALAGGLVHDFGAVPLNKLLNGVLTRSGTGWTVTIEGTAQGGTYTAAGNVVLNLVGNSFGGFFFNDVIADIGISAPTDAIDIFWPIDGSSTTTAVNSRNPGTNDLTHTQVVAGGIELFTLVGIDWDGVDKVVNGRFDTDLSAWVIAGNDGTHSVVWEAGKARFISDTTSPQLVFSQPSLLVAGNVYKFGVSINYTSGSLKTTFGISPETALSEGVNSFVFTASGASIAITRNSIDVNATIDNVFTFRTLQGVA